MVNDRVFCGSCKITKILFESGPDQDSKIGCKQDLERSRIIKFCIWSGIRVNNVRLRPGLCLSNMHYLSTTPTRILIRHAIFNETEPSRRVDIWSRYGSTSIKCLSQGHIDALPISGIELRVENIAVANLHSYTPNCSETLIGILALSFFPKKNISAICPVRPLN